MVVTFFLRAPRSGAFSIESLFNNVKQGLPSSLVHRNAYLPTAGTKPWQLFANIRYAQRNQSIVNHITGDVHYIAFGLPTKRTILTIHDLRVLQLGNSMKQKLLKLLWFTLPVRKVRYVTVISEATKKDLLRQVKIAADRVVVIPNCVSPAFTYQPKTFNSEKPRILHIGTKENKNLERLIKALEGLNCQLRVVGKLTSNQQILLFEHNIDFYNVWDLPFEMVLEEYRNADILSFVSLYEGFGMPVIEAQAVGRPVLSSNVSSIPEVAGEGACLVNPESTKEIRAGLLKIIEDEAYRNDLIKKGRENVKRFQIEEIAAQYLQLYKEVANV